MSRWQDILFAAFLLMLVLAPLPNGSNAAWAWPLLAAGLFLLGVLALLTEPRVSVISSPGTGAGWWGVWVGAWLLWIGYSAIQLVPLPRSTMAWLSPQLEAAYVDTLPGFADGTVWHSLAIAPAWALRGLIMLSACATAFILTGWFCRSHRRVRQLALALLAIGIAEAIYGLAKPRASLAEAATGTFHNRNHFAAFLVMTLMLGLGLLFERWQQATRRPAPLSTRDKLMMVAIGCGLMFLMGAVFLSFSRAAAVTTVLGGGLLLVLWLPRRLPRRLMLGIGIAVLALVVAGAGALDVWTARFQALSEGELSEDARVVTWRGSLGLVSEFAPFGVGLGGYQDAYARQKEAGTFTRLSWPHAHSDPLELLIESGIVGGVGVITALILYGAAWWVRWIRSRTPFEHAMGAGCLAAVVTVMLHSLVDFPFHVSAIALATSVLLALGWRVFQLRPEGAQG
ncbi:O-antigen ligase family protein [Candidatus Nitrospira bockiana]